MALLFVVILPSAAFCLPIDFFVDLGILLWARTKLMDSFRALVLPQLPSAVATLAPPALPRGNTP